MSLTTTQPGIPTLSFEETGNPDGQPLLLIHGYMSSNNQWELNREALGQHLRLILVEQPGHGGSPAPDDRADYAPEPVVAAIEEVRKAVGVERLWVGGHSLGGAMALRYALANQQLVNGVVMTNTRAAFGIARDPAERPEVTMEPGTFDRHLIHVHPIRAKRWPEDLKAKLVHDADTMPGTALANTAASSPLWRSVDELHRLQVPTMLVNGRWEKQFQPCVEQAREAITQLEVTDLEGGHSINIEQPDGFNQAVLDFIARHS
ncbi:MAG: alpha/beta fold hydrolase [Acidimicrobiales bacterium]